MKLVQLQPSFPLRLRELRVGLIWVRWLNTPYHHRVRIKEAGVDCAQLLISAAIAQATPADLLAIRQADQQFEKDIAVIGVDLEKIAADDRANARDRQIKTGNSWKQRILAAVVEKLADG